MKNFIIVNYKSFLSWYFQIWVSVVNATAALVIGSALRVLYKGFDMLGSAVIFFAVKVPKDKEILPALGDRQILKMPISEIAEQIRQRKTTAEAVVREFMLRVKEVNGSLNCVVDERFDTAIEEAKRYDRLIQSGEFEDLRENFPLLGIPFTIKDSFAVEGIKYGFHLGMVQCVGLRHTAGLYHRKNHKATEDSDVVKTLKKAGAIPIGVTNVSELCMWWESVNTVYGRSKNPYDSRHITGGSSGGEASLQGAAGSAFGIGSDIGGSIRMPAFFCGIYGHKPTTGLISNVGQVPLTSGRLSEFLTTGPLVRHAEDLRLLFDVMVGDNLSKVNKIPDLSKVRVFYMEDDGGSPLATPVHEEIKQSMKKVLELLEKKYGLKPKKANVDKLYHSLEIWAQAMSGAGVPTFCEELAQREGKINPFWEIVKFLFRRSPHTLPALVLGMIEKLAYAGKNLPRHKEMIDMGYALSKELQELLRDDGIMLYPGFPSTAPRHHEPIFRPSDFSYTAIFNVVGVPVTSVPLGFGSNGLPLGIQIVGGMFSDHLNMAIAQEIQDSLGGWVPPS